jgi:hypothetical protein
MNKSKTRPLNTQKYKLLCIINQKKKTSKPAQIMQEFKVEGGVAKEKRYETT